MGFTNEHFLDVLLLIRRIDFVDSHVFSEVVDHGKSRGQKKGSFGGGRSQNNVKQTQTAKGKVGERVDSAVPNGTLVRLDGLRPLFHLVLGLA